MVRIMTTTEIRPDQISPESPDGTDFAALIGCMTTTSNIICGNSLEVVAAMPTSSVDSIVTDPPYELGFMGKKWDSSGIAYSVELWTEALRVLKPGGHLLAFGGTRTYHRMAVAIEDAGFEIRDSISWLYGSGFPKSLDVSKAIDKADKSGSVGWFIDLCLEAAAAKGIARKQLTDLFPSKNGKPTGWLYNKASHAQAITVEQFEALRDFLDLRNVDGQPFSDFYEVEREVVGVKKAGMGTGLTFGMLQSDGVNCEAEKEVQITAPATDAAKLWEGWGTALKPACEPIVVARKPLSGTVAANVLEHGTGAINVDGCRVGDAGRWPANVILDPDAADELDRLSGDRSSPWVGNVNLRGNKGGQMFGGSAQGEQDKQKPEYRDTGGASRFFYCAKPAKSEKTRGVPVGTKASHPTVKPVTLMRYLCRLVTPPSGVVLDPFAGSGTTLVAATLEGFSSIGIELTPEYLPIIKGRTDWAVEEVSRLSPSVLPDAA
jgi:hypothetical protein